MIRTVALAGAMLALAACTPQENTALLQSLAQDKNPVCVDITLTIPWGTERVQINRLNGCAGGIPSIVAAPIAVKP